MAMWGNSKFDDLENKYLNGQQFQVGVHKFTLTLSKILPLPSDILHYDWKVTLPDGYEFNAKMGAQNLGYPGTRLGVIIEELKKAEKNNDDYLAIAINDKIDEIFRKYL